MCNNVIYFKVIVQQSNLEFLLVNQTYNSPGWKRDRGVQLFETLFEKWNLKYTVERVWNVVIY